MNSFLDVLLFLVPARVENESFTLQKIDSLDTYDHELVKGTPVMVTFTVSWYEWDGRDGKGQKTNRSPNKMKQDLRKLYLSTYRKL